MLLKIKNYELDTLAHVLFEMKLGTKKSRMRTKLLKIVDNMIQEYSMSHNLLIEEFALFNEAGELEFLDTEQTRVKLCDATANEYYTAYDILSNEENIIEVSEANKDMILTVAESFLEADVEISQGGAIVYDNLCEQFEAIVAHYEQKEESH